MPSLTTIEFPRPKDDKEFEELIRDLYASHWNDEGIQIYGRSGQSQNGVDVYGRPNRENLYHGIQCKLRNSGVLTRREIEEEVSKARSFTPKLKVYIIATTAPRDVTTQDIINELSLREEDGGGFSIVIRFWEDICSLLAEQPQVAFKHYFSFVALNDYLSKINSFAGTLANREYDNLIAPRGGSFFGRNNEITEIRELLKHQSLVIIGGIAGIGKSQLALKVASLLASQERLMWLDCEPEAQLEQFLIDLSQVIKNRFGDNKLAQVLQAQAAPLRVRLQASIDALNTHKIIVVWDNYSTARNSTLQRFAEACISELSTGKLVITTRERVEFENSLAIPKALLLIGGLQKAASLEYMQEIGLSEHPLELREKVFERLSGHPKFIALLAGLAQSFPLNELLGELPYAYDKIQEYFRGKIFNVLDDTATELLAHLALFRHPFPLIGITYILPKPHCYRAFEVLTQRFLVTPQGQPAEMYTIHDIVREFAVGQLQNERAAHEIIYRYYNDLERKRYLDIAEAIHHALNADLKTEAEQSARELLHAALYEGMYDLLLEAAKSLVDNDGTDKWDFVYYFQGRALRFKDEFAQALKAYNNALTCSSRSIEDDVVKLEIASVFVRMSSDENGVSKISEAERIYNELIKSSNEDVKLNAMSALGFIKLEQKRPDCISQLEEVLELAEQKNNHRIISHSCHCLGDAYAMLKHDRKTAIKYLNRSKAIQSDKSSFGGYNPEAWYSTNSLLGELYSEEQQYVESVASYQECVNVLRQLDIKHRLARSLYKLGKQQCFTAQYDLACESFAESLAIINDTPLLQHEAPIRSLYEWFSVSLWYSGHYKEGLESSLNYLHLCYQQNTLPNPHPIVHRKNLIPSNKQPEWSIHGGHILILPETYEFGVLMEWKNEITSRRPELAYISTDVFEKKRGYVSSRSEKIGRNSPCPCGSGKKYKHCCLNAKS